MLTSLFVVILGLCYCSKESSQSVLGRPELFGPSEALLKSVVDFQCQLNIYPENETILLQLFKEDNRRFLGEYSSLNGETATIPMVIKHYHEGNLVCVAKAQNNSKIEPNISYSHYLKVIVPVKEAQIVVHSGPVEFFQGETLELRCELTAGNHVSYKWLLNGRPVSQSHHHHIADDLLIIKRTSSQDSGSYMCIATNYFFNNTEVSTSSSSEVVITVRDVVPIPDISFSVLKEDSHNYSALITCQTTQWTLPITFSLYNGTELVAKRDEERNTTFKVPLVLGRHLGWFQCQANYGDKIAYSQSLPLEVVPVGGPVMMHYNFDVGENYAVIGVRFYCKATKGSLPRYQWFHNKTLLHGRGSFYLVDHQPPEQSILLLSVERSSAGTYHCEVSDSFDNTTAISSKRLYLDKEVLNRLPVLVVAAVFGCFAALVLLVSICCWCGAMYRRRRYGEKSLLSLEMEGAVASYEDELDESEYCEDADVAQMARGGEFDQASLASVDEWPQIEEEKKTLEPVEGP